MAKKTKYRVSHGAVKMIVEETGLTKVTVLKIIHSGLKNGRYENIEAVKRAMWNHRLNLIDTTNQEVVAEEKEE